jgi:hypothetical protein
MVEICKALPLAHSIHHVKEALDEQSVVWQSDVMGLGGIIFWLDAVRRVVLLEVQRASCEKSQVRL